MSDRKEFFMTRCDDGVGHAFLHKEDRVALCGATTESFHRIGDDDECCDECVKAGLAFLDQKEVQ